ncbi:MAG: SDR family NAD(P)-dependent oxidoreductase [Pseudomonadota bacterium]
MTHPSQPRVGLINQLLDRTVIPGMLTFSRPGYVVRQWFSAPIRERLEGRRVVLTGATSGLGLASAHALAALGADLLLVGRDQVKLDATADEIARDQSVDRPETECADLALMAEVRELAKRLTARPEPIHVLINNAGALFGERAETAEGHERSLAINLMSPYLLTTLLRPKLIESAPSRVINVSSGGMYTQRIRVNDLGSERGEYRGAAAYAMAKRGQVILTERWAEELADDNVVVHAMHPGWADTPGVRSSLPDFYKKTKAILRTSEEGADTIVWLAAAKKAAETTGGFWLDRQPHLTHVLSKTRETAAEREQLVEELQALCGV